MPLPLIQYVVITAAYSNAVLSAIMPHVSDYAKKLDLPIPQPITMSQVAHAGMDTRLGRVDSGIWLTNHYWFIFNLGYVGGFRLNKNNPFLDDNPAVNWPKYAYGQINMTTNQAIDLVRSSVVKLGHDIKTLKIGVAPNIMTGPYDLTNGKHVPYCEMTWDSNVSMNGYYVSGQVNMEKKTLIALSIISKQLIQANPPISVKPVLVEDSIKGSQSRMHKNTNAPAMLSH